MQGIKSYMSIIIILMGVSSSGKTSVAKEIQNQASDKYLLVGFDHAVESLDKKYWPGGAHEKEGFYYEQVNTGKGEFPELRHGPVGAKFLHDMMSEMIEHANNGNNLIVDFVMSDEEKATLIGSCKGSTILQVGIKPPLEEVIRREKARGDRKVGIAEAAYENFYKGKTFDIMIDTNELSPSMTAERILKLLYRPSLRK